MIRLAPTLQQISWFGPLLLVIRSLTILIAALTALLETDMKKIVAYSTLSQLGVIIAALGLNSPQLALFHLLTHAIFKALLFVCVGTFIHYHQHRQDLRTIGNLTNHLPLTQSATTISNLALIGTPFLAAFYSKDPIIELTKTSPTNILISILFLAATTLTATYTMRTTMISQLGINQQSPLLNLNNSSHLFTLPTAMLSLAAIMWGASLN
jgi:NADH-ubiquinone oxidoreductase chain 5